MLPLADAPRVGRSSLVRIPDGVSGVSIDAAEREPTRASNPLLVRLRKLSRFQALLMIFAGDPSRACRIERFRNTGTPRRCFTDHPPLPADAGIGSAAESEKPARLARDLEAAERRPILGSASWRPSAPLGALMRTLERRTPRLAGIRVVAHGAPDERWGISYWVPAPPRGLGGWLAVSLADPQSTAHMEVDGYVLRCVLPSGPDVMLRLANAPRVGGSRLVRLPDRASGVSIDARVGEPNPILVRLRELGRFQALLMILASDRFQALLTICGSDPSRARDTLNDVRTQGFRAAVARIIRPCLPMPVSDYRAILDYGDWIRRFDRIGATEVAEIRQFAARLRDKPKFSVLVPVYETAEAELVEMIASVEAQIYDNWELCIADDASKRPHVRACLEAAARKEPRIKLVLREHNGNVSAASNSALALATGEYVALLDHDDRLAPHALAAMADAANRHPDADVFYSDEDGLDAHGERYNPYFKPDWNAELLYGQNYLNHLSVFRTSLARAVGGFRLGFEGSQDYDLVLRLTAARKGPVVHVPHVLYHWRIHPGASTFSLTQSEKSIGAARRAIKEQLAGLGEAVDVEAAGHGYHRVRRAPPRNWPRVSVVIATRDHADALATCVAGLLEKTDYPDLEIVIADNDSVEPRTQRLFDDLRRRGVDILRSPGPFNFAKINNEAAALTSGEILLFLNNDVSMIEPGWLEEMASHAMRPGVGAVGAKLLYPDGTLQHAGVALGSGGVAGHIHVGAAGESAGYFGRLLLAQDIACVTAACMAVPRAVFDRVGGFDQENLPVAFNDVDLCIRIRQSGYRIIWTPHARLVHHESKSRGPDTSGANLRRFRRDTAYMRRQWAKVLDCDPFWNPNLSLQSGDPQLSFPPRIERPWRKMAISAETDA